MPTLTYAALRARLQENREKLAQGSAPVGVQMCGQCHVPLQESITGSRRLGDSNVCSDCYFDAWGAEIEEHPIGRPLQARGG